MNLQKLKTKCCAFYNNIKQQVANGLNSHRPPQKVSFMDGLVSQASKLCSRAAGAVEECVTKRARKGAQITLESDLKGHYKITVAGSKAAIRDAFEKLLKQEWL